MFYLPKLVHLLCVHAYVWVCMCIFTVAILTNVCRGQRSTMDICIITTPKDLRQGL